MNEDKEFEIVVDEKYINPSTDILVRFEPTEYQKFVIDQNLLKSQWLWDMYIRWAKSIIIKYNIQMDAPEAPYSARRFLEYLQTLMTDYYNTKKKHHWAKTMYYRNKRYLLGRAKSLVIDEWIRDKTKSLVIYDQTFNAIHSMYIKCPDYNGLDFKKGILKTDAFIKSIDKLELKRVLTEDIVIMPKEYEDTDDPYIHDVMRFSDEHLKNYRKKVGDAKTMIFQRVHFDGAKFSKTYPKLKVSDIERIFIYRKIDQQPIDSSYKQECMNAVKNAKYYLQFRLYKPRMNFKMYDEDYDRPVLNKYREV